jgi:RNA polymerase sigma factor (sigma-70 family)
MRSGDSEAARRIWERYSPRLSALARQRLPEPLHCVVDGDDIANGVFLDLIEGLQEGRFSDLHDRDDLWAFLACITIRKALNEIKRASRRRRPPSSARVPLEGGIVAPDPPPDLVVMAAEQFEILIECLRRKDEALKDIAIWKCEGFTNEEIAARLGCTCRRVMRKLELIRMIWETEVPR